MSAYIVTEDHINVIVSYFAAAPTESSRCWIKLNGNYNYLTKDNAEEVARVLFAQNVRSVDIRYNEENPAYFDYRFIWDARDNYTIEEIAGAISCLNYQSYETDDYYETEAYKILTSMRKQLLDDLQDLANDETWSIERAKTGNKVLI